MSALTSRFLFAFCLVAGLIEPRVRGMSVGGLRCEYRLDPVGIDVAQPRLSWVLESEARGARQTAFQVLAASSPEVLARDRGDLWDSGRVMTNQTIHVVYAGRPLTSRARAFWKVRVWDEAGRASAWSPGGSWIMGLLSPSDWQAKWIAVDGILDPVPPGAAPAALPATMFRRQFHLAQPVKRATVYVTGLGLYELRINGRRVGDQLLAPEWTDYRKTIQYQTCDVTPLLRAGDNAIGALVGEGWYAGRLMAFGARAYGSVPRFLAQVEVELADGTVQTVVSDSSWRATLEGPIRSAGLYDGEVYDARREMPGWDAPGFDDSAWLRAAAFELGPARLVWQRNEPIRIVEQLAPVKITEPKPGLYIADFGQNMAGWCRMSLRGAAGQTVTVRHGEMLQEDGTLYTANLRGAPQVDRYTFGSDGAQTIEPHFTYHGFRYIELAGLARPPAPDSIRGQVFCSSAPASGHFECSSETVNRLMRNIFWTQRANLMSTPTDCPQRNERFGWMGDIQAFSQTAIFNMDLAAFFSKWVRDIRDGQAQDGRFPDFAPHPGDPNAQFSGTPAWGDAGHGCALAHLPELRRQPPARRASRLSPPLGQLHPPAQPGPDLVQGPKQRL